MQMILSAMISLLFSGSCESQKLPEAEIIKEFETNEIVKMKVEIWSDVMCPFCYMGKRKFEQALAQFPHADQVEIEWKSFQLNPDLETNPDISVHESLAAAKGMSTEQAKALGEQVAARAAEEGLTYNFDQAVVANSFDAHRFSHLAKKHGLQDEAEEALFSAYFTDGKNIDDPETLVSLGVQLGIDASEVRQMLESGAYDDEVRMDLHEARQIGVTGVPFFVFDRKYAVSGAQPTEVFTETLNKVFAERKSN